MSPIEDLFITKEIIIEKLVQKSKNLIGIEKDKKEIIFLVPRNTLNDKELIGLFLLGNFYLKEAGLTEASGVNLVEISEKLDIENKSVSKRIYDLRKDGYVISSARGVYEIEYSNVEILLDEIQEKMG